MLFYDSYDLIVLLAKQFSCIIWNFFLPTRVRISIAQRSKRIARWMICSGGCAGFANWAGCGVVGGGWNCSGVGRVGRGASCARSSSLRAWTATELKLDHPSRSFLMSVPPAGQGPVKWVKSQKKTCVCVFEQWKYKWLLVWRVKKEMYG
jgi:hypothetical protein